MSRIDNHIFALLFASICVARVSTTRMGVCPDYRTGKRATYNPFLEVCCGGRLFPADQDTRTLCCGDRTYNPRNQICCGGEVKGRSEGYQCCEFRHWYDPSNTLCCGGHVVSNPLGLSKCCGSVAYNTQEKTCCFIESEVNYGSDRMVVVEGVGECCGDSVIDPAQQICCNGIARQRENRFSECCGDTTYDRRNARCCGSVTPYNLYSDICCDGNVQSKENGARCCGTESYSPSEASCCHDSVFPGIPEVENVQDCCGGVSYSKTSQLCCQGTLYDRGEGLECCNDSVYNASSELCCGFGDQSTVVHRKTTPADQCCGMSVYDPTSQTCCEAASRIFDVVGGQCCGTDPTTVLAFHPDQGTCCRGFSEDILYPDAPANQSSCCGNLLMSNDVLCNPMDDTTIQKSAINDNAICFTSDSAMIGTYNSQTQICLEDGSIENYSATVDVCDNLLFDPTAEICCEALIRGRFDEDGYERACCAGTTNSFTPDRQTCCYGNIHDIPSAQGRCCRTKAYDPSTHVCDDSGLVRSLEDVAAKPELCNHTPYHPDTHACCGGLLIPAGKYCCMGFQVFPPPGVEEGGLCCGYTIYDPSSQVCCGDTVYSRQGADSSCCGSRLLTDPESQICCDSTLHSRDHGRSLCDGYSAFNPLTETVCDGVLYSVPNGRCCGGQAYDENTEMCCDGQVHRRTSDTEECCGTITYNFIDSTTLCCNGHLHRGQQAGLVCCGDTTIDPLTRSCCDNSEFPSFVLPRLMGTMSPPISCCDPNTYDIQHSPHTCCGGVEHRFVSNGECCGQDVIRNSDEEICCGGRVVSRLYGEHTECCDSLLIDNREQTCCGDRILLPGGYQQCCGSTVVNTLYQTCCGGEVYRTMEDTGCCAGRQFSTAQQGCCGTSLYDLSTEECSDSATVIARPEKRTDVSFSGCEDQVTVVSDGNFARDARVEGESGKTACCFGRRYNPDNFDCCNGTLHHRVDGSQCCGVSYFNPSKEMCCNEVTVVSTLREETCPEILDAATLDSENLENQAPQCLCTIHPRSRGMSSTCIRNIRNKEHVFLGIVVDIEGAIPSGRQDCGSGSGGGLCGPTRMSIESRMALRGRLPSTLANSTLRVVTSQGIGCEAPTVRNGQKVVIFADRVTLPGNVELPLSSNDVILHYTRKVARSLRTIFDF